MFKYILRYFQRGMLSIFYNDFKSYNYILYFALLEEVKYFKITQLEKWLKDKTYLQIVKIEYSAIELVNDKISKTTEIDMKFKYYPT